MCSSVCRDRLNVMQGLHGPNVLSSQGPNVFDNARKYYNGQYFFDPALTMNASLQDQGGGVMHNIVMTPRSTDVVAFLNRLFNTLRWAMTEFLVSIREMQEKCQVEEMQCYEFCTYEIPEAFQLGVDTNLRRLASKADCLFLLFSKLYFGCEVLPGVKKKAIDTQRSGQDTRAGSFKGTKLRQLENFSSHLISRTVKRLSYKEETENDDNMCCICYTCEADCKFLPCTHVSCLWPAKRISSIVNDVFFCKQRS
ncbi:hypothetical protein Tco_0866266 [Tanacetum coccineum]